MVDTFQNVELKVMDPIFENLNVREDNFGRAQFAI